MNMPKERFFAVLRMTSMCHPDPGGSDEYAERKILAVLRMTSMCHPEERSDEGS